MDVIVGGHLRASEQADTPDASFLANYLGAKAQGLFVGAYHRAKPDASSGTAQADYFLDHAQFSNDGTTLPPVVDMEWPRSGWTGPHGEPLNSCYNMTPAQVVAWTRAFLAEVATRTGRLRFWQYTNTGRLSNGQILDEDVFSGDGAALASLAHRPPAALSSWADAKYRHVVHLKKPRLSGRPARWEAASAAVFDGYRDSTTQARPSRTSTSNTCSFIRHVGGAVSARPIQSQTAASFDSSCVMIG